MRRNRFSGDIQHATRRHSARFHVMSSELRRLRNLPAHELQPMFLEPLMMQANSVDLLFFDRALERVVPFP